MSYFCSACGGAVPDGEWPRRCPACGREHYRNPIPVAVVLLPVPGGGVVTVRRAIPPGVGKLALPGGFVNWGETWQQAGAREVLEETGILIDPDHLMLMDAMSVPEGMILLFSVGPELRERPLFQPNSEVSELVVVTSPVELAFSTHTEVLARWFEAQGKR